MIYGLKKVQKVTFWLLLPLLVVISFWGCSDMQGGDHMVKIKGSDTEVNVVAMLAEAYMENEHESYIMVTGGGSGAGIASLINQSTDIANSSRPIKEEEVELCTAGGIEPSHIVFAMDAIAIIVNEAIPINEISLEEVAKIFKGDVKNWNAFSNYDETVSAYGRHSNSGTFVYMRDNVLRADYSPTIKAMNGNAQIVESVRNDKAGIGYVGIGYVKNEDGKVMDGLKVLALKTTNGSISPLSDKDIISGDYPLTRPLYQYIDGHPTGIMKSFIEFELSSKGQNIIEQNGYFPVAPEYKTHNKVILRQSAQG